VGEHIEKGYLGEPAAAHPIGVRPVGGDAGRDAAFEPGLPTLLDLVPAT
jgi:hypothetical protein